MKDPSGALVPNARIEVSGGDLSKLVVLISDPQGHFESPDFKPGKYSLHVTSAGFESVVKSIEISEVLAR